MSENHAGHMPSSGRALSISAWLTGVYFIVELGIGLWTGSVAVISDAFHTFSAVGGVLVAIIAAHIAKRPADEQKSFGWLRAEIIGALVNGAFLLIMALVGNPIDLPTGPMLIAAAGGLVTEFISLYLLYRQQGSDLNVRGAYWHIIQTFVGSLIIIVAALVIRFTGFLAIDPLLGIIFGFVLLWASWGILRDAIHLLMEGTPDEISLAEAKAALAVIPGVKNVHHVHAWALTSGKYVFSAHVMVDKRAEIDSDEVLTIAQGKLVDEFGFFFTTIQVETRCHDEERTRAIDALVDRSMAT